MAYKVFVSYSTKDIQVVQFVKQSLENSIVEVSVAEYSVFPGEQLNTGIIDAIKNCDLFVLLWSRNAKYSDYVPQEIGVARGYSKTILPVVLEDGLQLPGFINDLKYLPAYYNPMESIAWLRQYVFAKGEEKQQQESALMLFGAVLIVGLFSQSNNK